MALTDPQLSALRTLNEGGRVHYVGAGRRLLDALAARGLVTVSYDLNRDAALTDTGRAVLDLYRPLRGFVTFEQAGTHRRGVARNDQGGATVEISWHSPDTYNRSGRIITRHGARHVQRIPRERIVLHGGFHTIGDMLAKVLESAR